jgi:phage baseplate assembly protein gpV
MSFVDEVFSSSAREQLQGRIFGVVTAQVTSMLSDGLFELNYLSMFSEQPSAPARMMMPMAGGGRGTYFMPEPGDEVVVAFEGGDLNQPIILGAVWNQNDNPPSQASAAPTNDVRTIVSRSGHEITLDDSAGREKVLLKTAGGHQVELDDTLPGKITIQSRAGSSITFDDATGTVTISALAKLQFSAPMITFQTTSASITAPGGFTVTTTGSVTASTFIIDGKPFGTHMHMPPTLPPPPATTGPVAP